MKTRKRKYPFETMEVNESITIPFNGEDYMDVRSRVSASAAMYCKKIGHTKKFSTSRTEEGIILTRMS